MSRVRPSSCCRWAPAKRHTFRTIHKRFLEYSPLSSCGAATHDTHRHQSRHKFRPFAAFRLPSRPHLCRARFRERLMSPCLHRRSSSSRIFRITIETVMRRRTEAHSRWRCVHRITRDRDNRITRDREPKEAPRCGGQRRACGVVQALRSAS